MLYVTMMDVLQFALAVCAFAVRFGNQCLFNFGVSVPGIIGAC